MNEVQGQKVQTDSSHLNISMIGDQWSSICFQYIIKYVDVYMNIHISEYKKKQSIISCSVQKSVKHLLYIHIY